MWNWSFNALFGALFKKGRVWSLFSKEWLCYHTFCGFFKKSNKRENFGITLFSLFKKSDHTFSRSAIAQPWVGHLHICTLALLLITLFCSFQNSNCAIALLLLFSKELLSDCSFCCSFQKSNCVIALFLLFQKEWICENVQKIY